MDDVSESLPDLIRRRQSELGANTIRALYQRLPDGDDRISYETLRLIANGQQSGSRDERAWRDIALMCSVSEREVRKAARVPANQGDFVLPPRARALDATERQVVLGVVEAILRAKQRGGQQDGRTPEDQKSDEPQVTNLDDHRRPPRTQHAARRGKNQGKKIRSEQDAAGEESQDQEQP